MNIKASFEVAQKIKSFSMFVLELYYFDIIVSTNIERLVFLVVFGELFPTSGFKGLISDISLEGGTVLLMFVVGIIFPIASLLIALFSFNVDPSNKGKQL